MTTGTKLTPLVKWVGGKRRLAPSILSWMPSTFTAYVEPFVGGGAVFAALWNAGRLVEGDKVWLNDANADMIALYTQVRDDPMTLIAELELFETSYNTGPSDQTEAMYYRVRGEWNAGKRSPSRFVFLKQTAFNGLWRLNASGELNAAWGKYGFREEQGLKEQSPSILDADNILAWSKVLRATAASLTAADVFSLPLDSPTPGTLIYLDPPYVGTFDKYTPDGFDYAKHAELLHRVWEWTQKGASVVYSNSAAVAPLASLAWPSGIQKPLRTNYNMAPKDKGREALDELLIFQHAPIPERRAISRTGVQA